VLVSWRSLGQPDPGRQYVALLTSLSLQRQWDVPLLFWHTMRIARQLRRSRGVVGYSLRAELLSRRFWTLSAWEDELALQAFVRTQPHGRIMTAMASRMGANNFIRWTVNGSDLPLAWSDALKRGQVADKRFRR
jgi:hypothetical protein